MSYTKEEIEQGVRIAGDYFAKKLGVSLDDFATQCSVSRQKLEGFYNGLGSLSEPEMHRVTDVLQELMHAEQRDHDERSTGQ